MQLSMYVCTFQTLKLYFLTCLLLTNRFWYSQCKNWNTFKTNTIILRIKTAGNSIRKNLIVRTQSKFPPPSSSLSHLNTTLYKQKHSKNRLIKRKILPLSIRFLDIFCFTLFNLTSSKNLCQWIPNTAKEQSANQILKWNKWIVDTKQNWW